MGLVVRFGLSMLSNYAVSAFPIWHSFSISWAYCNSEQINWKYPFLRMLLKPHNPDASSNEIARVNAALNVYKLYFSLYLYFALTNMSCYVVVYNPNLKADI